MTVKRRTGAKPASVLPADDRAEHRMLTSEGGYGTAAPRHGFKRAGPT